MRVGTDSSYMNESHKVIVKPSNSLSTQMQEKPVVNDKFSLFASKMKQDGLPQLVISIFEHYYRQLVSGETGFISNKVAEPVHSLPMYDDLDERFESYGQAAVLMNSFSTNEQSLEALTQFPTFTQETPVAFLQHKTPKIWKSDFTPAEWPEDPEKEWCPPGHGDLYAAIDSSGTLDKLLEAGFEYAFVSNSDNLGATLDPKILGYLAIHNVPFLMEVAERTAADRKGGHLARRPDGQLILRESAQCPPEEMEQFQDTQRYRFFNTNNLWVNLRMLRKVLDDRQGILGLPLIRNEKPVDPTQPASPRVYQLETAMGSAIAVFDGAQAICVPRTRFLPVKKNSDLLGLWSDAYELTDEYHLELAKQRNGIAPLVSLDDEHYGLIEELKRRFPQGAPSLIRCNELRVEGDVIFGKGIVIEGKIHIIHRNSRPYLLEDGTRLVGNS